MDPQDAKNTLPKKYLDHPKSLTSKKAWFSKIIKKRRKYVYSAHVHSLWDRQSWFPDPSLEPPNAVPFPSGPPRALPKSTLELPETPQDAPWSSQGRPRTCQIRNIDHQKTLEIRVFGPQASPKNSFLSFLELFWGSWDPPWSTPTLS